MFFISVEINSLGFKAYFNVGGHFKSFYISENVNMISLFVTANKVAEYKKNQKKLGYQQDDQSTFKNL
jgi:hypothetical protein